MVKLDYRIINPDSNIAIATLWSSIEQVEGALGDAASKVGIIGNLRTIVGINHLIATLSRFNKIDTLIIFGADVNGVGDELARFFITGELRVLLVPKDAAELVRLSIKFIDLRNEFKNGNYEALINIINNYYNPGKTPVRVSMEVSVNEVPTRFNLPLMGALIYETDTYRAWVKLVDLVLNFGFDGNGDGFREFLSPMIIIDSRNKPHPFRRFNTNAESIWYPRIKDMGDLMLRELRVNPRSLSAVINGGDYMVQGIISNDYYNQFVYLRSMDVLNDWCREAQRWWFLGKYIVESLNKEFNAWYSMGFIAIVPFSARVMIKDIAKAEDFVKRNESVFREFVEDPRGNFVITREEDSVILEHRLPGTHELISSMNFKSLTEAYEYLKNRNYFTTYSHAVYLGKELARAFLMKHYEQDSY